MGLGVPLAAGGRHPRIHRYHRAGVEFRRRPRQPGAAMVDEAYRSSAGARGYRVRLFRDRGEAHHAEPELLASLEYRRSFFEETLYAFTVVFGVEQAIDLFDRPYP